MGTWNTAGQWNTFWNAVTQTAPKLATALSFIAFLIMLAAIIKIIYERYRGSGGDIKKFVWAAFFCGILALPTVLIPFLLRLFDMVANAVTKLVVGLL